MKKFRTIFEEYFHEDKKTVLNFIQLDRIELNLSFDKVEIEQKSFRFSSLYSVRKLALYLFSLCGKFFS